MAFTIDCDDPKELLKQIPCISCISETQILLILVVVLNDYLATLRGAEAYELPDDLGKLMQDSACYDCMSEKQLLHILATFAAYLAYGSEGADQDFSEQVSCLLCGDARRAKSAIIRLLCLIVNQLAEDAEP
jgi:hypothetical protein